MPLPRLLAFSAGSIPAYLLVGMLSTYLPPFYAGKMGISLTAIGLTIGALRLADLGVDLFLGWLMDITKTPFGRYRPWFVAGLPVLWVAVYKVFNPPTGVDASYLFTWYILLYIAYSMLVLGHSAWAAALSGKYNERSRMFGWMLGIGVFGSSMISALPLITHGKIKPADPNSIPTIGWIIIVAATVAVLITLLSTPERTAPVARKDRTTLKDYLAVITNPSMFRLVLADLFLILGPGASAPIYLFFFHEAKGFELGLVSILLIPYGASGIVGAPVWAKVAQRLGKHRTVQLAGLGYAITQTILMLIPAGLFWPTFVSMFSVGFCGSAFIVLIRAMVADVADQLRLETGQERAGVLYALVTLTQKLGSSLAVTIIYPILDMVGFVAKPGYHNTPEAIRGLEMCYVFAPIILVVIGSACLIGYKLTAQRQSEIRQELEALESRDYAAGIEVLGGPGENIAARAS
ncbi:MFS transporter [Phenylobacterium sp.]|uniref:MFS transporter n=1 Tax=Phenylobacterium sp. TaxID=1871053 RepID=UPI0012116F72|nr:MFS transporter [Phenylobacterium sp.]THD62200.1 MAG: MFS transporter [Phenylobacterium sp.]